MVLFFYPLDFTFVCPSEILAFNKKIADFKGNLADVPKQFGDWTGKNIGNYMAVVLNDEVKSAAYIKSQIFDQGEISGRFSKTSADDLALTLTRFSSPDGDITPASIKLILDTFAERRAFRAQPQWLSSEAWNGVEAELAPAADEQEGSHWLFRAVCRGSRAYVMTVTGPREAVERNRETCLAVMSSLRLTAEE